MAEPEDVTKILIINLALIGDVILCTPVARALKERYSGAIIDMLVVPVASSIAKCNPYIDEVFCYDKKGRHKKLKALWQLISQLRSNQYDMVVTTNFALRGTLIGWIIGAKYRVGYNAQHARWFLTHVAPAERDGVRHEAVAQLDVVRPLGITTENTQLELNIEFCERERVRREIKRTDGRQLVVLCPAGSHHLRSWTVDNYASVLRNLAPVADCCLIGGLAEKSFLETINKQAGGIAQLFAGSFTLPQVAALIEWADLLISVDTGPLHISQAVNTPVIGLFGPGNPQVWGPRGERDVVLFAGLECSPCSGKKSCNDNKCMQAIAANDVIRSARRLLDKPQIKME